MMQFGLGLIITLTATKAIAFNPILDSAQSLSAVLANRTILEPFHTFDQIVAVKTDGDEAVEITSREGCIVIGKTVFEVPVTLGGIRKLKSVEIISAQPLPNTAGKGCKSNVDPRQVRDAQMFSGDRPTP